MSWGKLCDRLHRHRKVRKSGLTAMGLWVLANSWCHDQGTEGSIDLDAVVALIEFAEGAMSARQRPVAVAPVLVKRLVDAGFWEPVGPDSWSFHDWRDYLPNADRNPDKAAARKEKATRAALARWGSRDAPEHAPSIDFGIAPSMMLGDASRARDPVPSRPVPSQDPPVVPQGGPPAPRSRAKNTTPSPKATKPKPSPRPETWEVTPVLIAFGRKHGFDGEELEGMADRFKNHHDAKGSLFVDWDAAMRTWIVNQQRFDREAGRDRDDLGPEPPPLNRQPPKNFGPSPVLNLPFGGKRATESA